VPNSIYFLRCLRGLLVLGLLAGHGVALSERVTVAVASNFAAPMRQLATAFERETGHRVVMALGSTGSFYAQIRHGAPFQVLLAADAVTPQRLEREMLAVPETRITYAIGRIALWSAAPGRVDAKGQVLQTNPPQKLALANPQVAPYGAAAMQVMERLGVLPALRGTLVQGESVAQAYQFVASGNASMGFVALAQIQTEGRIDKGSAWVVPAHLHDPIRQDAVLLIPGRNQAGAQALMAFLRSAPAQTILRAHGYNV